AYTEPEVAAEAGSAPGTSEDPEVPAGIGSAGEVSQEPFGASELSGEDAGPSAGPAADSPPEVAPDAYAEPLAEVWSPAEGPHEPYLDEPEPAVEAARPVPESFADPEPGAFAARGHQAHVEAATQSEAPQAGDPEPEPGSPAGDGAGAVQPVEAGGEASDDGGRAVEARALEVEPPRPVGLFEVPPTVTAEGVEPVVPVSPHIPFTDAPPDSPRRTEFVEGEVRWAPELPPGWVAADEGRRTERSDDVGEPEVVGGGPPTYGAEPTAWPEADPDELDGLVPDTVLDGARYGRLTLRAVALKGDSARYRGQPRRDALLTARFGSGDDGLLLVAVASGARGADEAHQAAQDAVRWIAGAVGRSRSRLAGDLRAARRGALKSGLHRLTDRCYGRLRARGEELGLPEGDYTASLRCLLLPVDPECRIRLFFGLGEGGLFRIRGGSWQDLDLAPDEVAAPFRFRATVAQPGDALLMCSAGLSEPLRGEPELAVHLAERWGSGTVPGLAAYLSDAQTRVKGYADDRTAVTVWDA
ncbi:protein phosphatase 2C domain-containing protein, partial [Actinacidiphila rubida]